MLRFDVHHLGLHRPTLDDVFLTLTRPEHTTNVGGRDVGLVEQAQCVPQGEGAVWCWSTMRSASWSASSRY